MSVAQPSRPSSVVLRPLSHGRPNYSDAFPSVGEVIMMCLPFDMPGGSSIVPSTAISGSSSRNYHPCVVVEHRVDYSGGLDDLKWSAVIYVCRSYSGESDPTAYVESLGQDRKVLLPVPSLHCPDTPVEFGEPLRFDNFFARSPTWLVAGGPYEAHMGGNGPVRCTMRSPNRTEFY